ncbi:MAG: hypothetical protein WC881_10670 [Elusimicrobiota bacterium]|jgi:hypothetical protein
MMRRIFAGYRALPPVVQGLMKPAYFLFSLARPQKLVYLEGPERSGGKPLRLICTDAAGLKNSMLRQAFGAGVRERSLGSVSAWISAARLKNSPRKPTC